MQAGRLEHLGRADRVDRLDAGEDHDHDTPRFAHVRIMPRPALGSKDKDRTNSCHRRIFRGLFASKLLVLALNSGHDGAFAAVADGELLF